MGELRKFDIVIGILFVIATIMLIYLFFSNEIFFTWAFQRHRNILSWYIRPLFIVPIIWSAYKKLFSGISISIFSLFTSMFWFPKPNATNPEIIKFLNFEANYLKSGWTIDKIALFFTVVTFFIFIIISTWTKNWKLLLVILIAAAFFKIFNSYLLTGKSAFSMLMPAVTGLIVCVMAVFFLKKKN